jgi:hypothetical protein
MPQNHPNPKDAVSNTDDAVVSIRGMLLSILMEDSLVVDSWLIAGSIFCEQAHKNTIEPKKMFVHPMLIRPLFFIAFIPSFRSRYYKPSQN